MGSALRSLLALVVLACGCAGSPKAPATPTPPDEAALMAKIRAEIRTAPQAALEETEEAERRFGESPMAEERRALAIDALINLQRIGAARSKASDFLERYPNGPHTAHVQAMTGVHPAPSGPGQSTCPCANH
jgi:outer membrane protein assembly factor BamD (BamD/ComL family)